MGTALADLAVVIPVYNEQENIKSCVDTWSSVLSSLEISYKLIILNDGSWDETERVLSELPRVESITIIHKRNEGHGPTILQGYIHATETAEWVLQVDSDNEIPAEVFRNFWNSRHGQEAVLGFRTDRQQSFVRGIISRVAKSITGPLYNCHLKDVNIPFRLIRCDVLAPIIARIPRNTFAPNIIISGALSRIGATITELPVPFQPRTHGAASLNDISASTNAIRAFFQVTRNSRSFP
ncbi:MAG: hypothetical protein CL470_02170 [Acidimicrobiaceae bacterium]|nr:hypothetical protein [Acidimicrobiaceae bacterium]|tara:strand:- start:2967 stop:3680 length:714 start_codon:yes stop_codon:yes gene_type:complete